MRHQFSSLTLCTLLAGAVAACSDRPTSAPLRPGATPARMASANGGAPVLTTSYSVAEGFCQFDVGIESKGMSKMLVVGKAQGTTLYTSPGLKATLTNLQTEQQATLAINGTFHVTVDDNGNTVYVVTGPNLLGDPIAGLVLVDGVFSFAYDASGNLAASLAGQGRRTNICTLLS